VSGVCYVDLNEPITEAERSKARSTFARPNTGITGSNPSRIWMSVHVSSVFMLSYVVFFVLVSWGGVRLSPLGTSGTTGRLYQPRIIDDEREAVAGMRTGKWNQSTRRKPVPVSLYPPQIPHYLTLAWTRAAAVASRRLTAWAMARSCCPV
jgi:hypothetical protein